MEHNARNWNLQLFAAPAPADAQPGGTEAETAAPVYQKRRGGKQATPPGGGERPASGGAPGQSGASLEARLGGDDKQDFDQQGHGAVKRRRQGADQLRQQLAGLEPVVKLLGEKYGLDVSAPEQVDPQRLVEAMLNDGALWQAQETCVPEERPNTRGQGHRQDAGLWEDVKPQQADRDRPAAPQQVRQAFQSVMAEADALRAKYPDLDFGREMCDERFCQEVVFYQRQGEPNPFQKAYESRHFDELMTRMAQTAKQNSARQVASAVAANRSRPNENGASQAGISTAVDPSTFRAKEFAQVKKRMARGEQVTF